MEKTTTTFQDRQTALKIPICDIVSSRYIKTSEEFQANYVLTTFQEKVSRVNILGVVLSVDTSNPTGGSFVLDDGTGKITVRSFEVVEALATLPIGSIVQIVGKPRTFNNSIYLILEVLTKITDPRFIQIRKLEWKLMTAKRGELPPNPFLSPEVPPPQKSEDLSFSEKSSIEEDEKVVDDVPSENEKNSFEVLIDLIKEHDTGEGVDIEKLLTLYDGDGEKLVKILLEEGEIFEIKPGRVKVLE